MNSPSRPLPTSKEVAIPSSKKSANSNLLLVVLPLVILGLYFGKKYFFPAEEDQIHRRMDELAELISKDKDEFIIDATKKVHQALEFFLPPFQLRLEGDHEKAYRDFDVEDKQRIREALVPFKFKYPKLKVRFQNVRITVEKTKTAASSTATIRLDYDSESEGPVYDLYPNQLGWIKSKGVWHINDVSIDMRAPD